MTQDTFRRTLDGGLVMRSAAPDDVGRLSAFNARIHGEDEDDAAALAAWTEDLLCRPHPTFQPADFLIVEDPSTGEIVSSLNTISQTWSYEGIPFGVGRPELVGTDERYRNRGLVRQQFDVIHQWSMERGELIQVITGIPYFYRQFGYEMVLNLGGGRVGYTPHVPQLKEGEQEQFHIRQAGEADIPWVMKMHAREAARSMMQVVRDEAMWRYEILGKTDKNINRLVVCVIEDQDAKPVGYLVHPWFAWGDLQTATQYELDEGVSYLAVTPAVVRYLWKIGLENTAARGKSLNAFGLWLLSDHPAYRAMHDRLPRERKPYAYYVRVPDLPLFLQRIAPALEKRLSQSACSGHSGELKISFYRAGVRLVLEKGRLATIEAWKPKIRDDEGSASFSGLTFLQLLFGHRSLQEITYAFPDSYAHGDAAVLLDVLFPKKPSDLWAVS